MQRSYLIQLIYQSPFLTKYITIMYLLVTCQDYFPFKISVSRQIELLTGEERVG